MSVLSADVHKSGKIPSVQVNYQQLEMLYLNSTLNFGIPPVLVFQLEGYYEVDRLLNGLTAQQKGTTAQLVFK